ncbi:MAG: hypothetical protein AAF388_01890 [Bacteroidota bacterium]
MKETLNAFLLKREGSLEWVAATGGVQALEVVQEATGWDGEGDFTLTPISKNLWDNYSIDPKHNMRVTMSGISKPTYLGSVAD